MSKGSWKTLKTIPKIQSYQLSLCLMNKEQLDLNIIEINLVALYNENIMRWLVESMASYQFYFKYRNYMTHLLNYKLTETIKQQINTFTGKCDQKFVNGSSLGEESEDNLQRSKSKGYRLEVMIFIEQFNDLLVKLSEEIFKIQNDQQKLQHFQTQLTFFNSSLQLKLQETVSNSKQQKQNQLQEKGLYLMYKNTLQNIQSINITNSFFIKTKNRVPLVLDFGFGKFLYKNDDQLSHELISMQLIKYINAILGEEYIVPYQIIPLKCGAFYQFIENSYTVNAIKQQQENEGSLLNYFNRLCDEHSSETVRNRFAATYSGFCLIQYLLDIKDRNNANIMIRNDGSIFHVDLTFIFGSGPGGMSFQSAPFKMTKELVKILQGFDSDYFRKFEALLVQHFTKLSANRQELQWKMNVLSRRNKQIKCFEDFNYKNFCQKIPLKLQGVKSFVQDLIDKSYDSFKTNKYDDYQFKSNNILK